MQRLGGIEVRAGDDPDGLALADDAGELTWAQVAGQVDAVGGELLAVAPGADDRVAVIGENLAPTLMAHAAGILAGVGTVAVSRQLTADEMADQFRDAGVVAVVTGPAGLASAIAAARGDRQRWSWSTPPTSSPRGRRPGRPGPAADAPCRSPRTARRDRPWSTRPARPARRAAHRCGGRRPPSPRPPSTPRSWPPGPASPPGPHLVVGPLQHNGPLTSVRHLLSGQPVVVLGRFDAERVLQLVERYRVTSSVMVPTHFSRLLALPPEVRARYDVSSLRNVAHTGSACPADVKRAMIDWFGPVLVESYGGSEIGTVCRITSEEWLTHPGSVGRVVEPFEVVVLDESGTELGPGEVGVLGFRTPPGREVSYHADEEKTRSAYLAPGVATLGDVGYVTDDGFVFITDRVADMVVSGGVNLYPAESEKVLLQHPQVADVAVIGVPDGDLGEALKALVVPAGAAPDPAELASWCREHLASYKCPKTYEVVDALARNVMGKLDKRALRRPYWEGDRTIAG